MNGALLGKSAVLLLQKVLKAVLQGTLLSVPYVTMLQEVTTICKM